MEEIGLDNVVLELDSKLVVDSFDNHMEDLSCFSFIVKDCILSLNVSCVYE